MKIVDIVHPAKLSRRDVTFGGVATLTALSIGSRRPLGAQPLPSANPKTCAALDVELTEGPYYLDRGIYRKRISENRPGLPLHLRLTVLDARDCRPIQNAAVEIWHCDAAGLYSGFTKMNPRGFPGPPPGGPVPHSAPGAFRAGRPPGPPPGGFHQHRATDNLTFCRGFQISDAQGLVEFETLYPGWYMGRDVHIHLKVHSGGDIAEAKYKGGHVAHTGQFFFPDALTDRVAGLQPYAARKSTPRTYLEHDNVFADAHGAAVLLAFTEIKSNSLESGLLASASLHVDPTATPVERRPGGPPPPR